MSSEASTTAIATAAAETRVMRRRKLTISATQYVADAAHGVQQARLVAGLGLAAQVAHVDAQRVGGRAEVIAPHVLEDRRAGQHLAGMAQEHLQQQELGARERQHPLAAPGLVGEAVQAQVLEGERAVLLVILARAAQQRAHARQQLAQRERLDEVVVGAGVEARDAVVDLFAGGEHQHGRPVAALAQAPADLQAVDVGHRHVEDHDLVGRRRPGARAPRARRPPARPRSAPASAPATARVWTAGSSSTTSTRACCSAIVGIYPGPGCRSRRSDEPAVIRLEATVTDGARMPLEESSDGRDSIRRIADERHRRGPSNRRRPDEPHDENAVIDETADELAAHSRTLRNSIISLAVFFGLVVGAAAGGAGPALGGRATSPTRTPGGWLPGSAWSCSRAPATWCCSGWSSGCSANAWSRACRCRSWRSTRSSRSAASRASRWAPGCCAARASRWSGSRSDRC